MRKKMARLLTPALLACVVSPFFLPVAAAHNDMRDMAHDASPISTEEHAFGKQGDPVKVSRTIVIDMNDRMRFSPSDLSVKQGETIRFVVKNSGKMLHEMVIGTIDMLREHHEMMKRFPDMQHDEPYMLHVPPGTQETMIWQFTQPGEFHYACLIPGHFEAGMIGKIKVVKG